jgi:hypothetical protein
MANSQVFTRESCRRRPLPHRVSPAVVTLPEAVYSLTEYLGRNRADKHLLHAWEPC